MMLHKIMLQAQDSLGSYATQISSQLDYIAEMAQADRANPSYADGKAWMALPGIVCLENHHTLIAAYKVKELWSVFLVDRDDTKTQKQLLQDIKKTNLEELALGNKHFLLSTSPHDSYSYTIFIREESETKKSQQFKIENWAGDLRKTEHFIFELDDFCSCLQNHDNPLSSQEAKPQKIKP